MHSDASGFHPLIARTVGGQLRFALLLLGLTLFVLAQLSRKLRALVIRHRLGVDSDGDGIAVVALVETESAGDDPTAGLEHQLAKDVPAFLLWAETVKLAI